ncbi:similar to Saccharomyces cerevisiae YGL191W COX13 Subunit VIa of cytochrome c oxidase, which is the terminal member of the mitochondrial inner membrane electron transport chain [Maudiozyma saulgeensis]|uniref:Cytochrome c oxidase subunit 13, mitochondrial n=1 Tax=Maudiozyma saulgeensis TaxID=1789683 RepID=A0A1X7QYJ6_9SACH|nr:similar to Saccharomyces cerevisiae YGL191W COX13 Subunit VIa of cytochrome c oxidase, which is the terminal member of the mitochondrial inner membrane electron transport chain [Kazachstania saulgeensis]
MNSNILRTSIRRYASLPSHALKPALETPNKAAAAAFKQSLEAQKAHGESTYKFWLKISYLVAAPAILLTAANTYFVEKEHYDHRQHLSHVPDQDWPRDYQYMNCRYKPFFWGDGDKTLFWNPVVNRHINHDD